MTFKEKNLILDTTEFSTGFILKIRDKAPELQMFLDFALLWVARPVGRGYSQVHS